MTTTQTQTQPDDTTRSVSGTRAAIVGVGFMGGVHARAVRAAGGSVVGVVASSKENATAAGARMGNLRGFASLTELLEQEAVDVVHVCTPNYLHDQIALEAIAAGAGVICEKPLAVTSARSRVLVDAARKADVLGTVPFVYRYHPMVREFRERVQRGDAGMISVVYGSYLQDWLAGSTDDNWRVESSLGGASRAFGDIGSHWCDLLEFVLGDRIASLSALTRMVRSRRESADGSTRQIDTEDAVTMQFRTQAGVIGTLTISQVAAGRKNRLHLEVAGTENSFSFNQEEPESLWIGTNTGANLLARDPDTLGKDAARLSFLPAGHAQGVQDCFNAFVAETYQALDDPNTAAVGLPLFIDGLRAANICEAVIQSAAKGGQWQEVPG